MTMYSNNFVIFNFTHLLIVIQPENDRVAILPHLSLTGEVAILTIDQTLEIMEKIHREKFGKGIYGKIPRT